MQHPRWPTLVSELPRHHGDCLHAPSRAKATPWCLVSGARYGCSSSIIVVASNLATSAGRSCTLQARYRSPAGFNLGRHHSTLGSEELSRAGNFLAARRPHRIVEHHRRRSLRFRTQMSREMALVAYRNLLRSARVAFQGTQSIALPMDTQTYTTPR